MKRLKSAVWGTALALCALMANSSVAFAAEKGAESVGSTLSLSYCIPFVGMLLCIAICPLVAGEWWEKWKPAAVIFWSLAFVIPFAVFIGAGTAWEQVLESIIGDYLGFIVLLFGLFCVAGNIVLEGDLVGTPKLNVLLLLIGTALSGCLTPVGDPPLLMGFNNGVGFFWSLNLLPVMLLNVAILLLLFFIIDNNAYKKDVADGLKPETSEEKKKLHLAGAHNIIFMIVIVAAVILSGVLPQQVPFFAKGIHFYGEVELSYASILEMVMILAAAFLSFHTTKKEVREENHFTWDAIQEVAVLFIGIFITMIPALLILKARGSELGIEKPWQFFWMTGFLSSFLDNTPTYLVFFTTAVHSALTGGTMVKVLDGTIPKIFLMAISCGAVFMGANTYIGNAPNFMVRSIAEENGIKMPSFFGYMAWSVSCLIPVFIIDTLIFFLFV